MMGACRLVHTSITILPTGINDGKAGTGMWCGPAVSASPPCPANQHQHHSSIAHLNVLNSSKVPRVHQGCCHPLSSHQQQCCVCRIHSRRHLHSLHLTQPPGYHRCAAAVVAAAAASIAAATATAVVHVACCMQFCGRSLGFMQAAPWQDDEASVQERKVDAEVAGNPLLHTYEAL